jgi:hypothetical protein
MEIQSFYGHEKGWTVEIPFYYGNSPVYDSKKDAIEARHQMAINSML